MNGNFEMSTEEKILNGKSCHFCLSFLQKSVIFLQSVAKAETDGPLAIQKNGTTSSRCSFQSLSNKVLRWSLVELMKQNLRFGCFWPIVQFKVDKSFVLIIIISSSINSYY